MKKFAPLLFVCLLAGCDGRSKLPPGAGASPAPLPPPTTQPAQSDSDALPNTQVAGLSFSATPSTRTLQRGQLLTVSMEALNAGAKPRTLEFSSGQDFELQARRVEKGLVSEDPSWTWSADKMFTMALRRRTLVPGQKMTFEATWDGTAGGTRLARGEYEFSAFTASNPSLVAPPFRVTLQ